MQTLGHLKPHLPRASLQVMTALCRIKRENEWQAPWLDRGRPSDGGECDEGVPVAGAGACDPVASEVCDDLARSVAAARGPVAVAQPTPSEILDEIFGASAPPIAGEISDHGSPLQSMALAGAVGEGAGRHRKRSRKAQELHSSGIALSEGGPPVDDQTGPRNPRILDACLADMRVWPTCPLAHCRKLGQVARKLVWRDGSKVHLQKAFEAHLASLVEDAAAFCEYIRQRRRTNERDVLAAAYASKADGEKSLKGYPAVITNDVGNVCAGHVPRRCAAHGVCGRACLSLVATTGSSPGPSA